MLIIRHLLRGWLLKPNLIVTADDEVLTYVPLPPLVREMYLNVDSSGQIPSFNHMFKSFKVNDVEYVTDDDDEQGEIISVDFNQIIEISGIESEADIFLNDMWAEGIPNEGGYKNIYITIPNFNPSTDAIMLLFLMWWTDDLSLSMYNPWILNESFYTHVSGNTYQISKDVLNEINGFYEETPSFYFQRIWLFGVSQFTTMRTMLELELGSLGNYYSGLPEGECTAIVQWKDDYQGPFEYAFEYFYQLKGFNGDMFKGIKPEGSLQNMFTECLHIKSLDLQYLDTSKVTNMSYMFSSCENLISLASIKDWDTSSVIDMHSMFGGCYSLTSLDLSKWDTSNVSDMYGMFGYCSSLKTLDLGKWNTSNVTDMARMFSSCTSLTSLDLSNWNTSNVINMACMFDSCENLTSLDLSGWDVSKVTDTTDMFYNCIGLTSLDLSTWDISNVIDMSSMFRLCHGLTSLDLTNWDISNVTNMGSIFDGCSNLVELKMNNWKLSGSGFKIGITDISSTKIKTLDLSTWDVSNVTNMERMFSGCTNLTSLNLSGWDVSNVIDMWAMFSQCIGLTSVDLSNWDVGNIVNTSLMFYNCPRLTSLDLSSWDTSNVTSMESMFNSCKSLTSLDSIKNWDTSNVTNMSYMFSTEEFDGNMFD